jgi:hypothetical protein
MLTPEDDHVHPIGPEPNFNESMYFHFHDPAHQIGGFLRLANRPNEGRGERTVCLYMPDGTVAFGFDRPKLAITRRRERSTSSTNFPAWQQESWPNGSSSTAT